MKKKTKLESLQEPTTWVRIDRGSCCPDIPSLYNVIIERRGDERQRGASSKYRHANSWNDVCEMIHDVAKDQSSMWFSLSYTSDHITDLPPQLSFASLRNIASLTMQYYPTLEHLDLRGLPNLQIFMLESMHFKIRDNPGKYQLPRRVRISGLAQCLKLQKFIFLGFKGHRFLLEIKAPVRNLQALSHVIIEGQCMNRRLPFEFGTSESLIFVEFNEMDVTRSLKAKRKFAMSLCIALYWQITRKSSALVKALVSGPIHDPSLIHDVANKLSVKLD